MRRGLKPNQLCAVDERYERCFKPIPDEEGTETALIVGNALTCTTGFKPIPDEEGTETRASRAPARCRHDASNRSPMRRGLKHRSDATARLR